MISNKAYDVLKWIAQIGLPALGTAYFGLADIWNLPCADEVVGTIMVLDTFIGAILGIATANYKKGEMK